MTIKITLNAKPALSSKHAASNGISKAPSSANGALKNESAASLSLSTLSLNDSDMLTQDSVTALCKELLDLLLQSDNSPAVTPTNKEMAAIKLGQLLSRAPVAFIHLHATDGIMAIIYSSLSGNNSAAREGALKLIKSMCDSLGRRFEAFVVPWLPLIIECIVDKSSSVRECASEAAHALLRLSSCHAIDKLLPILYRSTEKTNKWQVRQTALCLLGSLAESAPQQIGLALVDIIPHVADCMFDMKAAVKNAAKASLTQMTTVVNNRDIESILSLLVECVANPEMVPECIRALAATTFVKDVESPTLAMIVPLLVRSLNERSSNTATLRQTSIIIDNMCKLVNNPHDVARYLPDLLPGLVRIVESAADPELRFITADTLASLDAIISKAKVTNCTLAVNAVEESAIRAVIDSFLMQEILSPDVPASALLTAADYVVFLISQLLGHGSFASGEWHSLGEYFLDFYPTLDCKIFSVALKKGCILLVRPDDENVEENHEILCNCDFSLAYGGMILLQNAVLKLGRGDRYGLCGKNGCGKSTLMRAIANGQVEGFPPPDKLRTVYVAHTVQSAQDEISVFAFVHDRFLQRADKEISDVLMNVGFTESMQQQEVISLSGGWKMKLELAMAMLKNADILLLDEPTNHLDVVNVAWLAQYLKKLTSVTVLIVSHDTAFMDEVCTHIIHYESKKLKVYRGNFGQFVEMVPEAKSYLQHDIPDFKFNFPVPGNLDGVKSRERKIIKMINCSYTYPGTDREILKNINIGITLNSRVLISGPNGAGKSTMLKLLTGETVPDTGEVQKHPSLRMAYVAQHAFHHLEQHLDSSPNAYIRWRFEQGLDKELMAKESRKMNKTESAAMEKMKVDFFCGRQKVKRTFKYEVKLLDKGFNETVWVMRERLEELGFHSLIQAYDDLEASRGGNFERELTVTSVQRHLEEFGLNSEFGTHNVVRGLSGGQKVKVVLAAAMWLRPHILVLDEPTNYLDIQSLVALSNAIRAYEGGVVMISHNAGFATKLCTEVWEMNAGQLSSRVDAALDSKGSSETISSNSVECVNVSNSESSTQEAALPLAPKVKKVTRRQKILNEKTKLAKLKKYGPKKDGTPYSSDEEPVEAHIHI